MANDAFEQDPIDTARESTLHDVTPEHIASDVEQWVDQLFIKQDAWDPCLNFTRLVDYVMHETGHKITLDDPENEFEWVDFVAIL